MKSHQLGDLIDELARSANWNEQGRSAFRELMTLALAERAAAPYPARPAPATLSLPDRVTESGKDTSGYRMLLYGMGLAGLIMVAWIASSTYLVLNDRDPLDLAPLLAALASIGGPVVYAWSENAKKQTITTATAKVAAANAASA